MGHAGRAQGDHGRQGESEDGTLEWGEESVTYVGFELAAPTLAEFIYRTWIENHIWFAEVYDRTRRELTSEERRYLEGYR